jgi:hypothetical protein
MSNLTVCQPGWLAVFEEIGAENGFFTEPVACWLAINAPGLHEVRPICALGGDVCDATEADNYVGVVGPGSDPKKFIEALHAGREARMAKETA